VYSLIDGKSYIFRGIADSSSCNAALIDRLAFLNVWPFVLLKLNGSAGWSKDKFETIDSYPENKWR